MQIVSVKTPIDDFSMLKELTEIEQLIEKAKKKGEQVIYLDTLSYQNHMYLIKQNYVIKKFIKKTTLFSFLRRPKKYYAIRFPMEHVS
ncbi:MULTISPECIES: hypothetical protein [Myroides]|uniref:Uncharacterized protein n=1 Tax=Myroides albus TaxID=2562892 RepID=A0A6I3LKD0_9FLAO|nr:MULTISPECIES: hypothetical protein [Myroides]MTG99068.1 hypothetical protein [Myroides albus]MVX36384.1 hypothetical protein [Myroides sp. LoEW2-1]UVD79050.1 hypothetical protein NWE55_13090 [Myroides albus]